jgi:hypothetical protein
MAFNYLPGTQVNTVDRGLVARRVPRAKSTVVIGTAGQGPAGNPYQVIDRAAAALTFGFDGNLVRGMEEVASYSDNVILFRMGTSQLALNAIGKLFATGVAISNIALTSNVVTVTTGAPHGLVAGNTVKVAAVTNVAVNGEFTVATAVDTTHFTYALVHANISSGADTGNTYKLTAAGFNIGFSQVTSDAAARYSIWYKAGVLAVWFDSELVFSNDSGLGAVDTGDLSISVTDISGFTGLQLGTNSSAALANAITVTAAAALTGTATTPAPTKVNPNTGTAGTKRDDYIALAKALDLLENFEVDQVYCPAAILDTPNVAYYDGVSASDPNDPTFSTNALDWIKVTTDLEGNKTYQWASQTVNDLGATVAAMGVVGNAAARIAAGFYEANFGYLLANFCEKQGETLGGCVGFVGTNGPKSFRLSDTRDWVGYLPTYGNAASPIPTVSGKGLLGIPVLVGCTSTKLNPLASDKSTGRAPGFYRNSVGQYDGGADLDINQNPIDIGAFIHVVGDSAIMTNGWKSNYEQNIAGLVCGLCSVLDEKSNLTNKSVNVVQLWKPSQSQLDALTFGKVNVLRFKNLNTVPALLHGVTAAAALSDYTNLLRVRIKFLLVKVIFDEADKFIGESTLDGLQLEAMKTALENRAIQLQKRGYVSMVDFAISTTDADRRLGHARIDVKFMPADELVQLTAYVGVTRR